MRTASRGLLLALATLIAASGATCMNQRAVEVFPPVALSQVPTFVEIATAVNNNTQRIHALQTENASLSIAGLPALRADLAMSQPRSLRLRAQFLGLTGPELDLGSNDYEFWIWSKYFSPRAVYFAQHAQFSQSSARQIMPVEPEWLFEALGLVRFDPGGQHAGPYRSAQGRLEVHSHIPTSSGDLTKITVVDDNYGWVLEHSVRDARGQLLASARASKHRFYPDQGASLPHAVDIHFPPAQMAFRLDVGAYQLNQPLGSHHDVWTRPNYDGYPPIDLATYQPFGPAATGATTVTGATTLDGGALQPPPAAPRRYDTTYRSNVRGFR